MLASHACGPGAGTEAEESIMLRARIKERGVLGNGVLAHLSLMHSSSLKVPLPNPRLEGHLHI
jgi:hypothetical protein